MDPLGFATPERLPTLNNVVVDQPFAITTVLSIQHQRLGDGPREGRIEKNRAIPHLHPPVPFGDQSDHRL